MNPWYKYKNRLFWRLTFMKEVATVVLRVNRILALLFSALVFAAMIYRLGYVIPNELVMATKHYLLGSLAVYWLFLTVDLLLDRKNWIRKSKRHIGMTILWLLLSVISLEYWGFNLIGLLWPELDAFLRHTYILAPMLLLLSVSTLSVALTGALPKAFNPSMILMVSFSILIIGGSFLLTLPKATVAPINYVDALFIATSAVCVTGLTSIDFAQQFTLMGQSIVLLLIQLGGLGLMTITSFFGLFFLGGNSFKSQVMVKDVLSAKTMDSLLRTLVYIIAVTLSIELVGMLLIWLEIQGTLGLSVRQELFFSLFHAVSAFCNAGFSTFSANLAEPILASNSLFITTISLLIVFGGIGFPIFSNLIHVVWLYIQRLIPDRYHYASKHKLLPHLYHLNTSIVLITTLILLLVGTISIGILEWNNAFAGLTIEQKCVQSFFHSVSPRTAGFSSLNMRWLSAPTVFVMLILMWIGGGAQSTAGGIKVNVFAVAILNMLSVLRSKERVEVMGRELSRASISRSNTIILLSLFVIMIAFMVLIILEPEMNQTDLLFEIISALSTVGLSLGITQQLAEGSKLVLIALMFIGRLGVLTFLMSFIKPTKEPHYRRPSDDIVIT